MTGKERTLRAIEFRDPDRVPVCLDFNRLFEPYIGYGKTVDERFASDIRIVSHGDPHFVPKEPGEDEWGCVWSSMSNTMGEVIKNPLADWENFDAWAARLPDYTNSERYDAVREERKKHPDLFMVGGLGMMMEGLINFRGFEGFMTDLYLERENLDRLIDILYQKANDAIDRYAEIGLDAVIAWEDWGLQDRLLIGKEMWREVFKPRMKQMIDRIHSRGMKYILHTCGYTLELFEDFIDLGIDVIQLDQQRNMGLDALRERGAGKICFWCPGDIQFAPKATPKELAQYCREMRDALSTAHGGFMYKPYPQPEAIDMPVEQMEAEISFFCE